MTILVKIMALTCLVFTTQARAATAAHSRLPKVQAETQQIIPRDTLRAGQDIELRKVQAMLSRQGPPPGKKSGSRR